MRRILKYLAGAAIVVAVGIQAIRPERTNPTSDSTKDITSESAVPDDVKAMLVRSCFDCHSNQTVWPWYSNIAPVSWLVAGDVKEGRKHLNFSEWNGYSTSKRLVKLEALAKEVDKEDMPPEIYTDMHKNAVLTRQDRERIITWAESLGDSLAAHEPGH
jgi:hypothetical protein